MELRKTGLRNNFYYYYIWRLQKSNEKDGPLVTRKATELTIRFTLAVEQNEFVLKDDHYITRWLVKNE